VKDRQTEPTPAGVPRSGGATQAGDVRVRWAWTELSVWTVRMLTALETGVKGGTWFSLMDKVYAHANLHADAAPTINAGPTPTSLNRGSFPYKRPMRQRVSPYEGDTTDRRAVCGRPARTVRREGEPDNRLSLPLSLAAMVAAASCRVSYARIWVSVCRRRPSAGWRGPSAWS
jgi:hypothetical protein